MTVQCDGSRDIIAWMEPETLRVAVGERVS